MEKKGLKVYISVDIEGVTGVTSWKQTILEDPSHAEAALQMKREAIAAAEGAVEAGATEIYVKDAHESGRNFDITGFPKECKLIRDWTNRPESMIAPMDETFDAVLYVGYHSPAGMDGNPLSHTMERFADRVKFEGKLASEFLIHAYIAAEMGVPSVFLSGDKALCEHVNSYDPKIRTVAVKEGIGQATISITPELAVEKIREGAREAILHRDECHLEVPHPLTMEIMYRDHWRAHRNSFFPGVTQVDPYTISFTGDTAWDVAVTRMFVL